MSKTATSDTPVTNHDQLERATYRIPEAATRADVSERTLWRLIDAKKVPGVLRFGKAVRISRKLFDEWIDGGGVK